GHDDWLDRMVRRNCTCHCWRDGRRILVQKAGAALWGHACWYDLNMYEAYSLPAVVAAAGASDLPGLALVSAIIWRRSGDCSSNTQSETTRRASRNGMSRRARSRRISGSTSINAV